MFGEDVDDDGSALVDDPVRILICDPHDLVRRSLTASLEEGPAIEVVAEAADGAQAVAESLRAAPDVVFVSLLLPPLCGASAIGLITEVMPGVDVVALAVEESPDERFDALRAGACGVAPKEDVLASPAAAIERLLRGLPFVDPELAGLLLARFDDLVGATGPAVLHSRERAVLTRIEAGEDQAFIADGLEMLGGEVRNHVLNVVRRLQAMAPPEADPDAPTLLAAVQP